jgi:hypothetical protein
MQEQQHINDSFVVPIRLLMSNCSVYFIGDELSKTRICPILHLESLENEVREWRSIPQQLKAQEPTSPCSHSSPL